MKDYLKRYVIAVQHPDISAFEHLDMLMVRDKLAEQESHLKQEEKAQLARADKQLLTQANQFFRVLSQITDLQNERQRRQPPPDHWWWYLDVLAQLPDLPQHPQQSEPKPV
jgi:hypothetical protein